MSRQSPFLIVEDTGSDSDVVEQPTVVVAKEPIPEVVPAKPDYSGQIVQVGTVMNSSVREVWVMDQRTNEKTIIKEGGDFEFYGVRGVVQSIKRAVRGHRDQGEELSMDDGEEFKRPTGHSKTKTFDEIHVEMKWIRVCFFSMTDAYLSICR